MDIAEKPHSRNEVTANFHIQHVIVRSKQDYI